uniref:Uncharacterized protein n=1 Tax=Rhizophora mucronata TaxID=61149 RepID=A0A2P2NV26_RHIMU
MLYCAAERTDTWRNNLMRKMNNQIFNAKRMLNCWDEELHGNNQF